MRVRKNIYIYIYWYIYWSIGEAKKHKLDMEMVKGTNSHCVISEIALLK